VSDDAEGTAAEIRGTGAEATFVRTDVSRADEMERLMERAATTLGGIDVIVNNAGLQRSGAVTDFAESDWDALMAVNPKSCFLAAKYGVPHLRRAGGGSIVNTSSALGVMGTPNLSAYVSSKYGVRGLTQTAALELARDGIRVNSIHPGYTRTPMNADVSEENTRDLPVARFAEPEEVTAVAMFLASEEASFVTGSEYLVDGGAVTGMVEVIEPS
jgi:3alpha(or 20beta)-hydroxysteroid dehydrogenase